MNGPKIPIATTKFLNTQSLKITNDNSSIPGFDLASANLNKQTIEFNLTINCKDSSEKFYLKNLVVLDKNRALNTYKINLNEWLKSPQ